MDILAPSTTVRNPDFVVAATADVPAFMVGVLDAERGEVACPEMYFIKDGDIAAYCEGFESVAGPTLTTRQILGNSLVVTVGGMESTINGLFAAVESDQSDVILDLFDYDAAADDQTEDRLDREYHGRGGW